MHRRAGQHSHQTPLQGLRRARCERAYKRMWEKSLSAGNLTHRFHARRKDATLPAVAPARMTFAEANFEVANEASRPLMEVLFICCFISRVADLSSTKRPPLGSHIGLPMAEVFDLVASRSGLSDGS